MLVDHPTTNLSSYILSRDSQSRLRSKKPRNTAGPCKLVGNLITSYSSMSSDPVQPHRMPSRDTVQCLLALLDQWSRCSDGLKSFQSRLTIRADTRVFLWSILKLNFINTLQDSIYLSLKDSNISSYRKAEPSSHRLPIDSRSSPLPHFGPICKPDEPLDCRMSTSSFGSIFPSQHSNPILWFKIKCWPHNINPHIKYGI